MEDNDYFDELEKKLVSALSKEDTESSKIMIAGKPAIQTEVIGPESLLYQISTFIDMIPAGILILTVRKDKEAVPIDDSFREFNNKILSTFRFIEQPEVAWSWNLIGCGSQAPCSYQVSSIDSTDSYVCAGKYDALSGQGEVTPTSTTDPRTTTDFICEEEI